MNQLVERALAVEANRRGAKMAGMRELVDAGETDGKRWQVYRSALPGGWHLVQTITHWRETIVGPGGERATLVTRTHVAVVDDQGVIRAEEDLHDE